MHHEAHACMGKPSYCKSDENAPTMQPCTAWLCRVDWRPRILHEEFRNPEICRPVNSMEEIDPEMDKVRGLPHFPHVFTHLQAPLRSTLPLPFRRDPCPGCQHFTRLTSAPLTPLYQADLQWLTTTVMTVVDPFLVSLLTQQVLKRCIDGRALDPYSFLSSSLCAPPHPTGVEALHRWPALDLRARWGQPARPAAALSHGAVLQHVRLPVQ